MKRIAIIGDYNPNEESHCRILDSIKDISEELEIELEVQWIMSDELDTSAEQLKTFDGFWFSPGSPYRNAPNVLTAIQFARENGVPSLGTCAGFQHMVIEFARNVLGMYGADSEENNEECPDAVIARLPYSLVYKKEQLKISDPDSIMARALGVDGFIGEYLCNYGFNEAYHSAFLNRNMIAAIAQNEDRYIRGFEVKGLPFFVGTLFIPQLDFKGDGSYRIIRSYLNAVLFGCNVEIP
ncbi:hypothetical protein [uncultured Ruminococcus sp.]|uniref:glutamine amidotransferase-related protein n=1 Tax=uncultured Ruminococcus sp. TaxID=165186 RepID=UPI0025EBC60B|nr:hypothetical protein [uncultured Ruminococcus sp.]